MGKVVRYRGILILAYPRDHGVPHLHAHYGGDVAVIRISDGELLDGSLPKHTLKMAQDWIRSHPAESMAGWDKARAK